MEIEAEIEELQAEKREYEMQISQIANVLSQKDSIINE